MKLAKLKEIIDKAVEYAEDTDPNVEIWLGEVEYFIKRIGQFGVIPNVTIDIELDKNESIHNNP